MQSDEYCVDLSRRRSSGRRQSTSWDNDVKQFGLSVPVSTDRRNSHTLAQLMEVNRQLSIRSDSTGSQDLDDILLTSPPARNSRRTSIAELSDVGITTKNTDDCVVVTQTLGTSTTYFFQKDPTANNLSLRPSAKERGLYNFDDTIKDVGEIKRHDLPRSSIQLAQPFPIATHPVMFTSIEESPSESSLSEHTPTVRPSLNERGLPTMKFATADYDPLRGRTLQKQYRRGDPRFNNELDNIIVNRRKILDQEEQKREALNLIQPRAKEIVKQQRPHHFDGRTHHGEESGKIMEELRHHQMDTGEVDRIVKEKKTTTLSPTGVPVQAASNRRSITSVEGTLPGILDRPYVRSSQAAASPGEHKKTVTIRAPDNPQTFDGSGASRTSP